MYFGEKYLHFDKVIAILDSKGVLRRRGEAKRGVMWEGRGGEGKESLFVTEMPFVYERSL